MHARDEMCPLLEYPRDSFASIDTPFGNIDIPSDDSYFGDPYSAMRRLARNIQEREQNQEKTEDQLRQQYLRPLLREKELRDRFEEDMLLTDPVLLSPEGPYANSFSQVYPVQARAAATVTSSTRSFFFSQHPIVHSSNAIGFQIPTGMPSAQQHVYRPQGPIWTQRCQSIYQTMNPLPRDQLPRTPSPRSLASIAPPWRGRTPPPSTITESESCQPEASQLEATQSEDSQPGGSQSEESRSGDSQSEAQSEASQSESYESEFAEPRLNMAQQWERDAWRDFAHYLQRRRLANNGNDASQNSSGISIEPSTGNACGSFLNNGSPGINAQNPSSTPNPNSNVVSEARPPGA